MKQASIHTSFTFMSMLEISTHCVNCSTDRSSTAAFERQASAPILQTCFCHRQSISYSYG